MERTQYDWQHEYLLTPTEYTVSSNDAKATYDQFMSLRDTLIYSNKFYGDKAGRSLIIWTKLDGTPTDTIEVWEPNIFRQAFEPTGAVDNSWSKWNYIATGWHTSTNVFSCEIVKDWRYVLQHKEQFINLASTDITRITAHILQHPVDGWNAIPRAVFDWERSEEWMFNRITSFGYVECDLHKWDWLEFEMVDQDGEDIDVTQLQAISNWWSIEYKDLIYN